MSKREKLALLGAFPHRTEDDLLPYTPSQSQCWPDPKGPGSGAYGNAKTGEYVSQEALANSCHNGSLPDLSDKPQ